MSTRAMNTAGQLVWLVGCGAFFASAMRADDPLAALGSILFAIGILLFLVPLLRSSED